MILSKTAIPASIRNPELEARVLRPGASGVAKPFLVPASPAISSHNSKLMARVDAIAASSVRARMLKLPQEAEDAKMTGSTRSLNRRLLGLNLAGSLMRPAS